MILKKVNFLFLPLGVNSSTFYNIDTKSNQFTLGYVSRIDPGKGWDIFLSALYILNKEFDVHAIIVGDVFLV